MEVQELKMGVHEKKGGGCGWGKRGGARGKNVGCQPKLFLSQIRKTLKDDFSSSHADLAFAEPPPPRPPSHLHSQSCLSLPQMHCVGRPTPRPSPLTPFRSRRRYGDHDRANPAATRPSLEQPPLPSNLPLAAPLVFVAVHDRSVPGPSRLGMSEHHGSPTPGLRDPDRLRLLHRATTPPSRDHTPVQSFESPAARRPARVSLLLVFRFWFGTRLFGVLCEIGWFVVKSCVKKMIERMRIRCSKHVGFGFVFLSSLVFVQVKEEDEERKVNWWWRWKPNGDGGSNVEYVILGNGW